MKERPKPLRALLDAGDITLRWLGTETCGEFAPTAEQFAIAADVLREGWTQRALERRAARTGESGRFLQIASLFVKIAFGGVVEGAWGHQYNKVGGERVDLSAEEFSDMQHDEEFFGNEEHLDSLRSCLPRVLQRIHMLERELFERNYPDLFRGKALTTQRRDRDAEYRWAEKAQGTYGERYRMLHEALLEAGVRYDLPRVLPSHWRQGLAPIGRPVDPASGRSDEAAIRVHRQGRDDDPRHDVALFPRRKMFLGDVNRAK